MIFPNDAQFEIILREWLILLSLENILSVVHWLTKLPNNFLVQNAYRGSSWTVTSLQCISMYDRKKTKIGICIRRCHYWCYAYINSEGIVLLVWNVLVNMYNTIVFVKNDMIINKFLLKCMWPKSLDRVAENIRLGRKLSTVATFFTRGFPLVIYRLCHITALCMTKDG